MITARAFRALHYDAAKVDMDTVLAPPYDVISDSEREELYARSEHNAVRLILAKDKDRYAAAGRYLQSWRDDGVLVRDEKAAFYLYVQEFAMPDGSRRERSGVLASVRLDEFSNGNILPHERTFPKAKADRMKIMEACHANLSPIFGIYSTPDGSDGVGSLCTRARDAAPWIDAGDNRGGRHRVWRICEQPDVTTLRDQLAAARVFIADGHHRYETALEYRDRLRADGGDDGASFNYVLMYLCPMSESGLVILPTHRLWCGEAGSSAGWVDKLRAAFAIENVPVADVEQLQQRIESESGPGVMALRVRGEKDSMILRPHDWSAVEKSLSDVPASLRDLDVTVLDAYVFRGILGIDYLNDAEAGRVVYTHEDAQAFASVDNGEAEAAFFLRAPRIEEVEKVCQAGEVMPQKSTYFHPKLQTGLVFHLLADDE